MPHVSKFISLITAAAALSALHAQQYVISTYAGGPAATQAVLAINAAIGDVTGVAVDAAGNLYFNGMNCVFRLDTHGALARVVGTGSGGYSGDGGPAINAQVYTDFDEGGPEAGVAIDRGGNLYIADTYNHRVRKVSPDGIISTVAGDGTPGSSGDGGPATLAQLLTPAGLAVDTSGNLYIADQNASKVRKVSPKGIISTVAGNGASGFSGDGAPATSAQLNYPIGVAVDGAGILYIADSGNNRIRKIDGNGMIGTLAGDGTQASSGDGGPAAKAQLNSPTFVAVEPTGNLYISTFDRVRRISPDGVVTTVAGDGTTGYSGDGRPARNASLSYSLGVAAGGDGSLYIADTWNFRVRKVSTDGIVTTVAGNGSGYYSYYGGDNGPAAGAQINVNYDGSLGGGMAVGREGSLYFADTGNNRIRKVSPDGIIATVAGNGAAGYSGDGGPALDAQFALPSSVVLDGAGTLYIADTWNFRIRKISTDGIVTTVAGNGTQGHTGDGGDARNAQIGYPFGLAIGADGSLYIADILYVRKVAPDGVITTLAGFYAGAPAGSGVQDGNVLAVAVDSAGTVYATDHAHNRVLKISPAGVITPYAGTGTGGFSGDGGPAISAQLSVPLALAVDNADNLYIGEWGNRRVRKISAAGTISTIAGNGVDSYSGDGGPATGAAIGQPHHLATGERGEIYLSDSQDAIRLLEPVGLSVSINIIASGASFVSGPIVPGELIVIGGSGLGPATLVSAVPTAGGFYSSELAGAAVLIDGIAAPLVWASATAVAAVVPSAVSGETAQVTATYQGQASMPFSIGGASAAPGIFTQDSSGSGAAAALNQDGSTNMPANPAKVGDVISLFATGLARFASSVIVTIGGQTTPAISVDTQSVGVSQVQLRIPDGVRAGAAVAVSLQAGSVSSPGVTVAVK